MTGTMMGACEAGRVVEVGADVTAGSGAGEQARLGDRVKEETVNQ